MSEPQQQHVTLLQNTSGRCVGSCEAVQRADRAGKPPHLPIPAG